MNYAGIQRRAIKQRSSESGMTVAELLIVVIIIAILVVLALPQVISSRRLLAFSAVKREFTTYLTEARQTAISERKTVTFRYDNSSKQISIYGGSLGVAGDAKNKKLELSGMGVDASDIVYGRPAGASAAALADGTNITTLSGNIVEIAFVGDGSVLDVSDNPENNALFLYHALYPNDTAFAVSVLGAGGRVKIWNYVAGVNTYVE